MVKLRFKAFGCKIYIQYCLNIAFRGLLDGNSSTYNSQKKQKYMPKCSMLKCIHDIYPGRIDMIIYEIYQLVGGFPAKFVSSRI